MVTRLGFEPKTHSLEGCCSIQLSYQAIGFAGAKILLFFKAWVDFCKKLHIVNLILQSWERTDDVDVWV